MKKPESLPAVIGQNARKIRTYHGVTLDALASEARRLGLKWSTARVVDLERGKLNPTLPMLIVLSLALARATSADVRLSDLLAHDGPVTVTDKLTALGTELQGATNGESVRILSRTLAAMERTVAGTVAEYPEATVRHQLNVERYSLGDERAARKLGLSKHEMIARALALWGRNLSDERDERAGADASPQRRGQITRTLINELQAGTNGND